MEIIKTRTLPRRCKIYLTSDYHYGALNASKTSLRHLIDTVGGEDNSYLVNLGDSIEAILPNDKRWATCAVDWQSKAVTPEQQCEAVVEAFRPIKDRILVWMMGNHEYKLLNSFNAAKMIANGLGTQYGSACCKLHLQFANKKPIKYFLAHGGGNLAASSAKDPIQRHANMQASLKNRLCRMSADAIGQFVGHGHHLIVVPPTAESELFLTDNGESIKQSYRAGADQTANFIPPESRWYGMTGSFLRLFSPPGSEAVSYSECAMYSPTEIGCLVATIEDGQMVDLSKVTY